MNIVWLSWKDINHPLAGGAENVSGEIMSRLARDGHSVRLITSRYPGSKAKDSIKGVDIYRAGGRFSVYFQAFKTFRTMRSWPDLVIDEMNTIPFGAGFYTRKRHVLLAYQLARSVWFYQMIFPFSLIGYLAEPVYLLLLSLRYKQVATESESTRQELAKYGFEKSETSVFRVGISAKPLTSLPKKDGLYEVLALGAMRPMKRTLDSVKAFELARDRNQSLKLTIAGDSSGKYAAKVTRYIQKSRHSSAIKILGRVSPEEKLRLMRQSSVLIATSIKEGWGLTVTEANSQGTPAVSYNVDGLRDSIQDGKTGLLVTNNSPQALSEGINRLLGDTELYNRLRKSAWTWSKEFTFENSYSDFRRQILE